MNYLNQQLFKTMDSAVILQGLLEAGAEADAYNKEGDTPLHRAHHYSLPCLRLLIQRGADIQAQNDEGDTPLHSLAKAINLNCLNDIVIAKFELLIRMGADIHQQNLKGYSPWEYLDTEARQKLIKVKTLYNKLQLNDDIPISDTKVKVIRKPDGAFRI